MVIVVITLLSVLFIGIDGSNTIRLTCIGDSITEGGGCAPETYVDLLATQLGTHYSVVNAGASGRTMLKKGLLDDGSAYSYWNADAWQKALTSDPHIVTIILGTNDAKFFNWEGIQQDTGDYYALDYVDMIATLRKQTNVKEIFIAIPPPLFPPYPFSMNQTIINTIYPTLLPNIAQVANVHLVDLHTPMAGQDMTCDGCHPTHDGNVVIANTLFEAIKKHSIFFNNNNNNNGTKTNV